MWTDFNIPFTFAFCREIQKKLLYNLPHHLKSVAALLCKMWMFNWTTHSHIVIQFKSVLSRLFSVNINRDVTISIVCLYADSPTMLQLTTCVENIRHQHADMLWVMHATCQWMRRWRVVQCWAKRLTDAVAIYCADVTSNDVNGTQKRQL